MKVKMQHKLRDQYSQCQTFTLHLTVKEILNSVLLVTKFATAAE